MLELIQYKPKLVICEKPLCNDYVNAAKIVDIYEAVNIPLLINYTRRFVPELITLKKNYQSGLLGKLVNATITFNRGMIHTGTHAIDFLEWLQDGDTKSDDKLVVAIKYMNDIKYRVWNIQLFFENFFWQEQRIGSMDVPEYFDFSTRHVVDNAYAFLYKGEALKCTGKDAVIALRIAEDLSDEMESYDGI